MVNLASPPQVRELLARYGVRPRKRWGQNFLIDRNSLALVVRAAELEPGDAALEIGPGLGALTRELAATCRAVLAVEIDPRLAAALREVTLADLENVTLLQADALEVDLPAEAERALGPGPRKVVANIPYSITSPLVVTLLEARGAWSLVVLLVQKEVAERLAAAPDTDQYGALTLFARFYAEVEKLSPISRRAFWPPPEVDSMVVRLRPRAALPDVPPEAFFGVTRAAFQQRRKRLLNALAGAKDLGWSRERASAALAAAGIDPGRRGETLSLEEFVALARAGLKVEG